MAGDSHAADSATPYQPLNAKSQEIRVFDSECSQKYDAELRGSLRTITLLHNGIPETECFEALSYTWGSKMSPGRIFINGVSSPLSANLESFLRSRRRASETVTLWVDAICINQNDDDEKSSQIPLIGNIYMYANAVTIWLGPAADNSDFAMRTMLQLGSGSPYDKMPILERRELAALNRLLNRPWWCRVWIIQEVVFGGIGARVDKIRVVCGNEEIPWLRLVIAAARVLSYKVFKRQYFPCISHILELETLRENAFNLNKRITSGFQSSNTDAALSTWWSLELVSLYRRFQATEPKDKVYALALMFTTEDPISIRPNYSDTLVNVYREFAEWCMRGIGDIEVLKHCGGPSTRDLPSWVPDWSIDLGYIPLPSTKRSLFKEVPWWSGSFERVNEGPGRVGTRRFFYSPAFDEDEATRERVAGIRMKQLKIGAGTLVKLDIFDEVPPNHISRTVLDAFPEGVRDAMAESIRDGHLVSFMKDSGVIPVAESSDYDTLVKNLLRQTQKSVERALKESLVESYKPGSFFTAGTTVAKLNVQQDILAVEGLTWDTIEEMHEGFVSDIETKLDSATEFLVAVGQCKSMAEESAAAIRRYPSLENRFKAFWLTILAGQIPAAAMKTGGDLFMDYMTWLPPLPESWTAQPPELTATTTGLLWYAEGTRIFNEVSSCYCKMKKRDSDSCGFRVVPAYRWDGLVPAEWTEADRQTYKKKV